MLEPLIDGQDDHLAGPTQLALHQHAAEVCLHAGGFAFILAEDLLNGLCRAHRSAFLGDYKVAGLFSPYEILPKLANLLAPTSADFRPFVPQPCRKGGFWRIRPRRAAGPEGRAKQKRLPDNVQQALVRKKTSGDSYYTLVTD
jgi:hypothetical protein